jgi:transcriptional regulator with XRE-family HTH domain
MRNKPGAMTELQEWVRAGYTDGVSKSKTMSNAQIAKVIQHRVKFLGMDQSAFLATTGLNLFDLTDVVNGESSEITVGQLHEALETLNLILPFDGVDEAGPWRKSYLSENEPVYDGVDEAGPWRKSYLSENCPPIGEMIRKRRVYLNLSQSEVARYLGVSNALIGHWETGKSRIMADDIPRIAAVLKTTSAQLMGDLPTDTKDASATLRQTLGKLSDRMSLEQLGDLCVFAVKITSRS